MEIHIVSTYAPRIADIQKKNADIDGEALQKSRTRQKLAHYTGVSGPNRRSKKTHPPMGMGNGMDIPNKNTSYIRNKNHRGPMKRTRKRNETHERNEKKMITEPLPKEEVHRKAKRQQTRQPKKIPPTTRRLQTPPTRHPRTGTGGDTGRRRRISNRDGWHRRKQRKGSRISDSMNNGGRKELNGAPQKQQEQKTASDQPPGAKQGGIRERQGKAAPPKEPHKNSAKRQRRSADETEAENMPTRNMRKEDERERRQTTEPTTQEIYNVGNVGLTEYNPQTDRWEFRYEQRRQDAPFGKQMYRLGEQARPERFTRKQ